MITVSISNNMYKVTIIVNWKQCAEINYVESKGPVSPYLSDKLSPDAPFALRHKRSLGRFNSW